MSLSGGQLSGGNTATQRAENDFYATDPEAVAKLLDCFERDGIIIHGNEYLEPCVGTGNIINAFDTTIDIRIPYEVQDHWTCLDIVDRGYPKTIVQDYLTWQTDLRYDFIITNPPYSLAAEFVEKGIDLLSDNGICCMYLKLQFLEGVKRKELFDKYPPKYIYVFRKRMATWKNGLEKNPETGKKWAETIAFAWFVWVKGNTDEPVVRWID